MSTWLASFKLAAVTGYLKVLPSLDAVSNTQSIMKKVTNAFQIVGFAGAIAIGTGCFALMAWGGDRLRDKIKSHLVWIIISVMSTSCVILLIPFSNYRIMHSIIIKMAVLKKFHRSHRQANGSISRGTALIADGSKA